jgi:hypothetical protein
VSFHKSNQQDQSKIESSAVFDGERITMIKLEIMFASLGRATFPKRMVKIYMEFSVKNLLIIFAVTISFSSNAVSGEPTGELVSRLGPNLRADLVLLEPISTNSSSVTKKSAKVGLSNCGLIFLPIQYPLSKGHGIQSVKCSSSDDKVLMATEVLRGNPLGGDDDKPFVVVLIKPKSNGKATLTVEFEYNAFATKNVEYTFQIEE